jgi:RNA polymerase sigma factor (sigma-70 family)
MTDAQLLGCFIEHRDDAAFAALVRRHGSMVWGGCRRLLPHHDAEDAFQATFLVLVRKAASVLPRAMVANWLYGVAHQTALKARATTARRRGRERQVTRMPEPAAAEQALWRDLQPLLDQELARLPDKYRVAIVLCDLEGKTRKEGARQLGCPEGTLAARLARARAMLAKRLSRRGVVLSGGALAAVLSQNVVSAGVPPSVVSSTIKAASLFAAGPAAAAGAISAQVAALTEGVLRTMLLTKLKIATAVALLFVLLCAAGLFPSHAGEGKDDPPAPKRDKKQDEKLKATLLALDTEYWDAWTRGKGDGDRKVVARLLADNYLGIWGGDPPIDKAAGIEGLKRYRCSDRTVRDVDARRVSKDTAVLTYLCSMKAYTDNGGPVAVEFRGSNVWTRRAGGWVLVFQHAHPLQANEPPASPPPFGK